MPDSSGSFDLVVIGSGPAGQKGAIAAAKLGKRVAIVDRKDMIGGVSLHTGTIPSKTVREAILYLSGFRQRAFYGRDYVVKEDICAADLKSRVLLVMEREMEVVRAQLRRNRVTLIPGTARFLDPHHVEVETTSGPTVLAADFVLIAVGTRPASQPGIPFDGHRIINSDQLQFVENIPRDLIIVGAGIIGIEYASMFTALDIAVTVIDQRPGILEFVDAELTEALMYHMRERGAIFRLGEKVASVGHAAPNRVVAVLESGKEVSAEALLCTVGRQGNSDLINIEAAGLTADARGRVAVNEHFQTNVPHIYAAGDVIGFPALAASSMEQGRYAGSHMFGCAVKRSSHLPYGVYTVPEISMVGKPEQQLTGERIPYEFGIARYSELAKGQMLGDTTGMLKILFDPASLMLLGIHAMGEQAAEIVHIGQAVMALGGTLEYFLDTTFNYPTFAEAYKVAALSGMNRLAASRRGATASASG